MNEATPAELIISTPRDAEDLITDNLSITRQRISQRAVSSDKSLPGTCMPPTIPEESLPCDNMHPLSQRGYPRYTKKQWEEQKDRFEQLYVEKQYELDTVAGIMECRYDFRAR
jgi:Clr5 domain